MVGLVPVVNVTTPLISVPATDIADGVFPAPVDAVILSAPEFPFKCLAIISELVVIAPEVFTLVIEVFPSCMLLAVAFVADCPMAMALVKPSDIFAPYPMAIL